jgi:hypothetical protein
MILYLKFHQAKGTTRPNCATGCGIYSDVIASPPSPVLPTPLLPPGLTEASTALERDPGIYRVNYDLADQKSQAPSDVTSNFTAFIFQVQNGTRSHYYFKVGQKPIIMLTSLAVIVFNW